MSRTVIARVSIAWLVTILSVLTLAACQPPWSTAPQVPMDQELPFETIRLNDHGTGGREYVGREPKLVLLLSAADIPQIEPWIDAADVTALQQVDFTDSAAVALFRGRQSYAGFPVVIERIGLRGHTLVVQAQFWEPPPGSAVATEYTSPYHLVKILKVAALSASMPLELHQYAIHK